jgi:hypothetical protein
MYRPQKKEKVDGNERRQTRRVGKRKAGVTFYKGCEVNFGVGCWSAPGDKWEQIVMGGWGKIEGGQAIISAQGEFGN